MKNTFVRLLLLIHLWTSSLQAMSQIIVVYACDNPKQPVRVSLLLIQQSQTIKKHLSSLGSGAKKEIRLPDVTTHALTLISQWLAADSNESRAKFFTFLSPIDKVTFLNAFLSLRITPDELDTTKALEPLLQTFWNSTINEHEKLFADIAYAQEFYKALEQLAPSLKLLLKEQLPKKEITDALFGYYKNKMPHFFLPYEHLRFSPASCEISVDWNPGILRSVRYSSDERAVIASYAERFVAFIDCTHNKFLHTFSLRSCYGISTVTPLPLNDVLLIQSSLGSMLYNSNQGAILYPSEEERFTVKILTTSKRNPYVLVYNYPTSNLKIINKVSNKYICHLGGHNNTEVTVACFDRNESSVLSAAADGTIKIWHLSTKTCTTIKAHEQPVRIAMFNNLETRIISADQETIKIWDLATNKCIRTFSALHGNITNVWYTDPLEQLIAVLDNGTITLRELKNGLCIATLNSYMGAIQSIAVNSLRTKILAGDEEKNIYTWDLQLIQKLYYITQELSLYDWLYISCAYKRKTNAASPFALLLTHPFLNTCKNLHPLLKEFFCFTISTQK